MKRLVVHLMAIAMLAAGSVLAGAQPALAHSGREAGWGHTLAELGLWSLGVGVVLAGLVSLFWVRALVERRERR